MKIGFSGWFLNQEFTGIGKYSLNLLEALSKKYPKNYFIIAVPSATKVHISKIFEKLKNVKIEIIPEISIVKKINSGLSKAIWERYQLPKFFRGCKVETVHIPYPSAFKKGQEFYVATVHDLAPWILPEYKRKKFLPYLYQKLVLYSFLKVDHLLTVSEFSRQEIVRFCQYPKEKISISPNACNEIYGEKLNREERLKVLKKYHVDTKKPFIFYIGGYDQRKNVESLVKIYLDFIAPKAELNLILAGGKLYENELYSSYNSEEKLEKSMEVKGEIIKTGFIEEQDLPAFYQEALVYVNLSSYEGFNLPLLEALVSETPVICSETSIHREVGGETANYFNPLNEKMKIAEFILKLFQDKSFLEMELEKVKNYKNNYTWEKTADIVYSVYKKFQL